MRAWGQRAESCHPAQHRRPTPGHRSLLGIDGIAMMGAGVLGFVARAAGLAPRLGATPPHMPTALTALPVGAVWVTAWTIAAASATRSSRRRHATSADL